MSEPLIVINSISINAPATKVWDVLTNPLQTKKYMFGCEAISDWKPGSFLLWKGKYEGKEMVFVKGNIVEIETGKFLSYTTIDPNSTLEDLPENYLTVTYELEEDDDNGDIILTATQGDYSKVGNGEKRYNETIDGGGWEPILIEIKKIAEAEN